MTFDKAGRPVFGSVKCEYRAIAGVCVPADYIKWCANELEKRAGPVHEYVPQGDMVKSLSLCHRFGYSYERGQDYDMKDKKELRTPAQERAFKAWCRSELKKSK